MMNPILPGLPLKPAGGVLSGAAAGESAGRAFDGFGSALTRAIQQLDQLQAQADEKSLQLAAGEPVELHDVMIAQDTASLSLQLALQVRNKMVEAYQEIMRMQM